MLEAILGDKQPTEQDIQDLLRPQEIPEQQVGPMSLEMPEQQAEPMSLEMPKRQVVSTSLELPATPQRKRNRVFLENDRRLTTITEEPHIPLDTSVTKSAEKAKRCWNRLGGDDVQSQSQKRHVPYQLSYSEYQIVEPLAELSAAQAARRLSPEPPVAQAVRRLSPEPPAAQAARRLSPEPHVAQALPVARAPFPDDYVVQDSQPSDNEA